MGPTTTTPSRSTTRRLLASLSCGAVLLAPTFALAQDDVIELAPVVVEGHENETEAGTGVNTEAAQQMEDRRSIVAQDTAVGTKTDTPILEVPASVSVVTQRELEQRAVDNLDQALAYTSGVATRIYGTDNRYDFYLIRGFYQTATGSYRDGLPMRIPGFVGSRVEPFGMSRIEVLKGSTSTLFGLNAPGGLVNAVTKVPLPQKFGEIYMSLGDHLAEGGADFGGPIDAEGQWLYRFTIKGQDGINGISEANDDRIYVAPAITWQPTDMTALTVLADYNWRAGSPAYGIPRGSDIDIDTFLGEPSFDTFDTKEWNVGYQFRHEFDNGLQFRQNLRYTDLDLTYETVYGAQIDPTLPRSLYAVYGDTQRFVVDNQLQYDRSWRFLDSRTLAGLEYYYDEANEYRIYSTAPGIDIHNPVYCGPACLTPLPAGYNWDYRSSALGIYAQEEVTLYDKLILTLGGRYDNVRSWVKYPDYALAYDSSDDAWTGRAGVTYMLRDDLAVYANYSESFQPVSADVGLAGPAKPQEGTQYEVGVKYRPDFLGNALFTLAAFDITQTNVPYYINATTQAQVGEIRVRGVEFEGKFALNDRLNATLAYSYWDPEILEDGISGNVGNQPQNVPNHIGSAWVDYTIPGHWQFNDLTIGAGIRYIGPTYADNANTIKLNDRFFVDAALSYKLIENGTFQINVTNLFNEREVVNVDTYTNTDYYNDGRLIKATFKYTW
ncbi:TonB-dependent siderophore receptor [Acuticoccus mangrovi]|uniref:TonB-dependent siderophore receptor n=1 Tax=Acuticoccus mangrovi TaxID=2796142 RepID=A0A934ITZ5_9HYPH|nr:TonB-dependent siderophore receptor [Acuticoccus mangrovi]MBJ3778715.1 TonB-dependent siderophore receptor [Acuticoccus mangrovi]